MTRYRVFKDGVWQVYMHRVGRDPEGHYSLLATTEDWDTAIYIATSDPANKPTIEKVTQ